MLSSERKELSRLSGLRDVVLETRLSPSPFFSSSSSVASSIPTTSLSTDMLLDFFVLRGATRGTCDSSSLDSLLLRLPAPPPPLHPSSFWCNLYRMMTESLGSGSVFRNSGESGRLNESSLARNIHWLRLSVAAAVTLPPSASLWLCRST